MRIPQTTRPLGVEALEERDLLSAATPISLINSAPYDPHSIIVGWTNSPATFGTPAQDAVDLGNGEYRIDLKSSFNVEQALAYYWADSNVAFAQPDYTVTMAAASITNDPYSSSQWALQNINAAGAWSITTGAQSVLVATIDSGVDYNAPDLAGNIWSGLGYNFLNNTANPMDDNGHGTVVAGIIGAVGNNGIGVAGVDWNVKIMALKFLDSSGNGQMSNAIRALNYAVANGAKVVNMSFSGGAYDPGMAAAIQNAQNHGVIIVTAAGNSGTNIDTNPDYPASYSYSNVITVAAIDSNNNLASFSNYGPNTVDLAAPGVSILSTTLNGGYAYYSGTSMAAPFVTGAVALIYSLHPNWTYQQVIADIEQNVDPVAGLQGKVKTGGKLDLAKAVAASMSSSAPVTSSPTVTGPYVTSSVFSGSAVTNLNNVRVTFSSAINIASLQNAVSITSPNGSTVPITSITAVAGSNNSQFDIHFANGTVGGRYNLVINNAAKDLAGNGLDQNRNGTSGQPSDYYYGSSVLQISAGAYGSPPLIQVFDPSTGSLKFSFYAFDPSFLGGVSVALGNVLGNGTQEIIVGAGLGGGGHVQVFDGNNGTLLRSFLTYPGYNGAISVAAGDVMGSGYDEIITGSGFGTQGHVKVFDVSNSTNPNPQVSFYAYAAGYIGGVSVAAGNISGNGKASIITGSALGASHIEAFSIISGSPVLTLSFMAFGSNSTGVNVTTNTSTGTAKIVATTNDGSVNYFNASGNSVQIASVPATIATVTPLLASTQTEQTGREDVLVSRARPQASITSFLNSEPSLPLMLA